MKLKFVDQPYQNDAVNSICDIFEGCEVKDSIFTIDESQNDDQAKFESENVSYFIGHSNRLTIDEYRILDNVL